MGKAFCFTESLPSRQYSITQRFYSESLSPLSHKSLDLVRCGLLLPSSHEMITCEHPENGLCPGTLPWELDQSLSFWPHRKSISITLEWWFFFFRNTRKSWVCSPFFFFFNNDLEQHGNLSEFSHCPSREQVVRQATISSILVISSLAWKLPYAQRLLSVFLTNSVHIIFNSITGNT